MAEKPTNADELETGDIERDRLAADNAELREALTAAAKCFRDYERIHLAKDTPDRMAKAQRNADMAVICEQALSGDGSAVAAVVHYAIPEGDTFREIQDNMTVDHPLYQMGDMRLIWVNEGDILMHGKALAGTEKEKES